MRGGANMSPKMQMGMPKARLNAKANATRGGNANTNGISAKEMQKAGKYAMTNCQNANWSAKYGDGCKGKCKRVGQCNDNPINEMGLAKCEGLCRAIAKMQRASSMARTNAMGMPNASR